MPRQELQVLSDEVWERTWTRLAGLTDEEYFWEPAPGVWTVRRRGGEWCADGALPRPEHEPFTTIAWRLWHLIDMYGEDRAPRWLHVEPQGPAIGLDDPEGAPPRNASDALTTLERAHDRWDAHLSLVDDEALQGQVGSVGGQYRDRTRESYVLHMLDEFIHHGAEISMLRDLWRWQRPVDPDPIRERILRGDAEVLDEIGPADARDALLLAAEYSRWDLVSTLVRRGTSPNTGGRTPLHSAAIVGALDIVQLLVEHGADTGACDPEFEATPLQWAEFTRRSAVVEWMHSNAAV
jgi:hypothetical protein